MDKPLLTRFIREMILDADTPSLIISLAGNFRYLVLCREILNSFQSVNPKFFSLLNEVCLEHGIELEWLNKRLMPAARALGLQLKRRAQVNYYAVLGINEDADLLEIKKAFRKKAYQTHPDTKKTNSDDRQAFIEITDAYRTLSNEVLRHHYDLSRQSLSKWHELPGPIIKVKEPKKIFAVQLVGLLLVLSGLVFLFEIIFHEDSEVKSYTQPESLEVYRNSQINKLWNESPEFSMKEKRATSPQLFANTIPFKANDIPVGSDVQQNALADPPSFSKTVISSTIGDSVNFASAASEPAVAETKVITIESDSGNNQRKDDKKKARIQITIHEDSNPAGSLSKGRVVINKKAIQHKSAKNLSPKSVSEPERKRQAAAPAIENAVITAAMEQPLVTDTSSSIANRRGDRADTVIGIEKRLEHFLAIYCRTYEEKNLNKFANFFTETAQENGKSISSLFPKYNRNFSSIDEIKYQIKIQKYSYDFKSGIVDFEGKFSLEWLPKGENWQINFGKIAMVLIEKNDSFQVEQLNYSGF